VVYVKRGGNNGIKKDLATAALPKRKQRKP